MAAATGAGIVLADRTRFVPSLPGTTVTETVAPFLVVVREPSASGTILVPTRRTFVVSLATVSLVFVCRPGGASRMIVWTLPMILWGVGVLAAVALGNVGTNSPTTTATGMSSRRLATRIRNTCSCPPTPTSALVRRLASVVRTLGRGLWSARWFERSPTRSQGGTLKVIREDAVGCVIWWKVQR